MQVVCNFRGLCVHVRLYMTPNVINQLKRPNLTHSDVFVKFFEDLTKGQTNGQKDKQTDEQQTTAKFI